MEPRRIVNRRCDRPMARSKKLLPCDHNCKTCVACIEMDEYGSESHAVRDCKRESDPKLTAKILKRMSGYEVRRNLRS